MGHANSSPQQPQRPFRPLRVRDENQPPAIAGGKSLHQRNKSTPVLSTLMQVGVLKAGNAKRTVFADVSNTVRGSQPAKDDLLLSSKHSFGKEHALASIQEITKPAPLSRPAQRPLSVVASKNTFNASNTLAPTAPKPSVAPVDTYVPVSRKPLIKRATTIFKETTVSTNEYSVAKIGDEPPVIPLPYLSTQDFLPELRDIETSATVEPSKQLEQLPEIIPLEPIVGLLAPVEILPAEMLKPSTVDKAEPGPVAEERFLQQELPASAIHDLVTIHDDNYVVEPILSIDDISSIPLPADLDYKVGTELNDSNEYLDALEHQVQVFEAERFEEAVRNLNAPAMPEEEYWDEEDEEEYYEADGYTTARSFRSRGDNTTGGMTIVLAPRVTAKTEKELAAAKVYVDSMKTPEDIEDEVWDTSMVAEYSEEIFEYMHELEEKMRPNPYYMDIQTEIQWSMRSVLMDWLVQVHHRFTLLPETLFLSVNYVDRFLSKKPVSLGKLQLVGATAIFLAAKYEEINCPSVNEIVYMVDGGYNAEEILKAERFMLNMLNFELGWPGPMSFLRKVSKADDYDLETRTLAKYFLEITIMDERFVGCVPSFLAAGAHCLARLMLRKGDWVSNLYHVDAFQKGAHS